jgi:SWI/SNF-related matrix-associated actin-dependent regulator 1 of chromatin subfamily A
MLAPFVLRRRKAHVLELPPKTETVESCAMTKTQATLYRETLKRSKKVLEELDDDALDIAAAEDDSELNGKKSSGVSAKQGKKAEKKNTPGTAASSSNILMDLRKAASHPLLFRRLYTDAKVRQIAKECLNTPKWCESNFDYVVEDLEVSHGCSRYEF